mmetsp:Transcript_21867/g.27946  ORF Transcript_21867/g.27946 Transcript_21867/m.27946 type:complete len:385 (+) Transcript_21867:417-1571(+)
MGIKGLMKLLSESAEGSYKTAKVKNYMGRVVAIDASMQLYQFMSMVRAQQGGGPAQLLANEDGDVTSHLMGFFYRTIRLMEAGLKPVYVFDGKPPEMKGGELMKRKAEKEKAANEIKQLEETLKEQEGEDRENAVEMINKAQKRNLKVTKQHNAEAQQLLKLMGVPVILAPCEAEAQCAELCKKGKVFATVTEDMDALTFATPILLRNLTYAESRKLDVFEIHYDKILTELNLKPRQFVDLCILCGCDYSPSIKGIGPKTALKLIKEHGSLEAVLQSLDRDKYTIPDFLENNIDHIRQMFENADVTPGDQVEIKFQKADPQGIKDFLVNEKNFGAERIESGLKRLEKTKQASSQKRLDSFFKVSSAKRFNKTVTNKNNKKRQKR